MSAPNSTGMTDAAEPGGDAAHAPIQHRRLARSTLIFSVATGLSRVLGLVREMVAAYYFGINGKINAFTVAFQIPNLVRALLADAALSGAFVPVFSDLLEKGERSARGASPRRSSGSSCSCSAASRRSSSSPHRS